MFPLSAKKPPIPAIRTKHLPNFAMVRPYVRSGPISQGSPAGNARFFFQDISRFAPWRSRSWALSNSVRKNPERPLREEKFLAHGGVEFLQSAMKSASVMVAKMRQKKSQWFLIGTATATHRGSETPSARVKRKNERIPARSPEEKKTPSCGKRKRRSGSEKTSSCIS